MKRRTSRHAGARISQIGLIWFCLLLMMGGCAEMEQKISKIDRPMDDLLVSKIIGCEPTTVPCRGITEGYFVVWENGVRRVLEPANSIVKRANGEHLRVVSERELDEMDGTQEATPVLQVISSLEGTTINVTVSAVTVGGSKTSADELAGMIGCGVAKYSLRRDTGDCLAH